MCEKKREIISGRAFYHMPSPFASIKITVEDKYCHERMLETAEKLEKVHPIINNVVVGEEGKLWFRDVGKHVQVFRYTETEMAHWKEAVKKQMSRVIDLSKEPGVGIAILEHQDSFDLTVMLHHIYGDGISLKYLVHDLLYIYITGNGRKQREPFTGTSEKQLFTPGLLSSQVTEDLECLREMWDGKKEQFTFDTFYKMNSLHNKIVRYELALKKIEGAAYRGLRQQCERIHITMNSAIATALAAVSDEGTELLIPVNTRPLLGISEESGMTNLASSIRILPQYQQQLGFWENAAVIHRQLCEARSDTAKVLGNLYPFLSLDENLFGIGYYAQYGMYREQNLITAFCSLLNLNAGQRTLDISNIGKMQTEEFAGKVRLRDCYMIPNLPITCDAAFGAVSMEHVLTLTLGYTVRRMSVERAENTLQRIVDFLTENI